MPGTSNSLTITSVMPAIHIKAIRRTPTAQQTWLTTETSSTHPVTECSGSRTSLAQAGTHSWTAHGRFIPAGALAGSRLIRGDGLLITMELGFFCPGMAGRGSPEARGLAGT